MLKDIIRGLMAVYMAALPAIFVTSLLVDSGTYTVLVFFLMLVLFGFAVLALMDWVMSP